MKNNTRATAGPIAAGFIILASFSGAAHARYIEADPTGLAAGPNLYSYVGQNPTQAIDFWGLATTFTIFYDSLGLVGAHSAFHTDHGPNGPLLYDPAGSYRIGDQTHTDTLSGSDAAIAPYLNYHSKDLGDYTETYTFNSSKEVENALASAAQAQATAGDMTCADHVYNAVQGAAAVYAQYLATTKDMGPFQPWPFQNIKAPSTFPFTDVARPGSLADQFANMPGVAVKSIPPGGQ